MAPNPLFYVTILATLCIKRLNSAIVCGLRRSLPTSAALSAFHCSLQAFYKSDDDDDDDDNDDADKASDARKAYTWA